MQVVAQMYMLAFSFTKKLHQFALVASLGYSLLQLGYRWLGLANTG